MTFYAIGAGWVEVNMRPFWQYTMNQEVVMIKCAGSTGARVGNNVLRQATAARCLFHGAYCQPVAGLCSIPAAGNLYWWYCNMP